MCDRLTDQDSLNDDTYAWIQSYNKRKYSCNSEITFPILSSHPTTNQSGLASDSMYLVVGFPNFGNVPHST